MARRPILYLPAKDAETVHRFLAKLGQPVKIGLIEVGQVVDVKHDEENERVGLVIEWSNQLEVVTQL